jgi:CDP-glycerol glycerophosphotransferase (TagB/SpsB family)
MIKNIVLKKVLKNTIFKAFSIINKFIPKDENIVLLYSANKGIQYSLIPLRDYLMKNGFDKKYRIVCGIENLKYRDNDGLEYISRTQAYKLFFKAKHVFYTTGQIPIKPSTNQCVIHLRHGNTNFKSSGKKTNIHNGDEFFFTYMAATSTYFKRIMSEEYGCQESNIIVVGDPLIDELLEAKFDKTSFSGFSKMMLWLPTFRKSDYLGYDDSTIEDSIPLFGSEEYKELNNELAKRNIKLIVKLHPAQNVVSSTTVHYSNLDVYTNDDFLATNYTLFGLMKQSDVLIGDYSSALMQYLVLDKPLAFVVPDIDEYVQKRGFVFKNPEEYMGGHIIKDKRKFYSFLDDITTNKDVYKEKRHKILHEMYEYTDNHNCERIVKLSGMTLEN